MASTMSSCASLLALILSLAPALTLAHGGSHEQMPLQEPNDWASQHMVSEHHISGFDSNSFFSLHDYDNDGTWERSEIRRTYGMAPGSTDGVGGAGCYGNPSEERVTEIVNAVLADFDRDNNGFIDRHEFNNGWAEGRRLRDFGHGPGHHGDDEYEYELHHFERFHDENTTEADLTHPEDKAHFARHEAMDAAADRQALLDKMSIVEANIPAMFRRVS